MAPSVCSCVLLEVYLHPSCGHSMPVSRPDSRRRDRSASPISVWCPLITWLGPWTTPAGG